MIDVARGNRHVDVRIQLTVTTCSDFSLLPIIIHIIYISLKR